MSPDLAPPPPPPPLTYHHTEERKTKKRMEGCGYYTCCFVSFLDEPSFNDTKKALNHSLSALWLLTGGSIIQIFPEASSVPSRVYSPLIKILNTKAKRSQKSTEN